MKISPTRYSGLPTCCASRRCCSAISASLIFTLLAKLLAQHLAPAELGADLVDQRALADAVGRQLLPQAARRQAVARLDVPGSPSAIALSGITILRRCTSCMRSRSSMSWRVICCFSRSITSWRQRQAGRDRQTAVRDCSTSDVADHVAIDHRDDAGGLHGRRRRQLRPGGKRRCRRRQQQCQHGQRPGSYSGMA